MAALDQNALTNALDLFFQPPLLDCPPEKTEKYTINAAFREKPYWVDNLRGERFCVTLDEGILYRPKIVNEICNKVVSCLEASVKRGIMIKGPQGIGKSHSLVNTVRKLQSTGEYLVTFIPDCEAWQDTSFLLEQICASFGSTLQDLGVRALTSGDYLYPSAFLVPAIKEIDAQLTQRGKKWVFVFDQINKLFVKPMNKDARDASGLAFPFSMIKQVLKPGRITSVISASANNEMAYKESHEGFVEYHHRTNMTEDELRLAFFEGEIDKQKVKEVLLHSDGVPLYALMYHRAPGAFQLEVNGSVQHGLDRLRPSQVDMLSVKKWERVQRSIYSCLLGTRTDSESFDKKFMVLENAIEDTTLWRYRPLFPAVLSAYRKDLWDDLMEFVGKEEQVLLGVCSFADTTNDTRGRIFETIVIRRCQAQGVEFCVGDVQVNIGPSPSPSYDLFSGKLLPALTVESPDRVHIPLNPNFPAIDLVWKHGRTIIGVQVHVSKHKDVAPDFFDLCEQAGWFQNFHKVYLLYLSPEENVTNLVRIPPGVQPTTARSAGDDTEPHIIIQLAISKDSVTCLKSLQWPNGCSLH